MQGVDIGILVVLLLPALTGLIYGFLNIVFSITAWVLALGISITFGPGLSPLLTDYIDSILLRDIAAFASIFIISLMVLTALGYFIVKLLGRAGLTAADRLLGFFFGIGLGGAIITVMIFLAGFTALTEKPWWRSSVLIEPFQHICIWGQRFLPDNVAAYHRYGQRAPEREAEQSASETP